MGATSGYNDMTSFEFSRSGCSWCHPGGGGLEYDREGYRYDARVSGLIEGEGGADLLANPTPENGDYYIFGIAAGADASSFAGAGFFIVDSATKGIRVPQDTINGGTMKMANDNGTWKLVGKKYNSLSAGGVAEADCMMCHYANQYSQIDRNWAAPGYTAPKWSASLGLVGAKGETGLITPGTKAGCTTGSPCTVGTNPALGTPTWLVSELTPSMIVKAPKNEGCSTCHFFDNAFTTLGPAGKPMGNTAWQKYMAVGAYPDSDIGPSHASYNGGNNIAVWQVAKGKPEGGKRSESINDNNNPDVHMKWPAYSGSGPRMTCSNCHYNLEGTYGALMHDENVIYPEITVQKIDHQFAKGDNLPDGKNMDQLDSTVTCASCHTERTHPNNANAPTPAHAGFPAVHFEKLDCRVCHVPVLNAKSIWKVADFTVGPFRTFERNQAPESPLGSNAKPLYIWRQASTSDTIKLEPVNTTVVPVWTDNSPLKPTYQRVAKSAAEAKRTADGYNASGVANFALNQAQGGDTTLIVNTTAEITDMVSRINSGAGISTAVMNFYINTFDVSHNIMPKGGKCIDRNADGDTVDAGECNYILGSTEGGGCVMCHSSSNTASANYDSKSVGFFDKTHTLFAQPTDGGQGIVQTEIDGVKRVNIKFSTVKSDGTTSVIDLSKNHGETVGNTLNQGEVLGYDAAKLQSLVDCTLCHTDKSMTSLAHPTTAVVSSCTTCHTTQHQSALNVDVACGSCHGGSAGAAATTNGAPYLSRETAAMYAPLMHSGSNSGTVVQTGAEPVLPPSAGCNSSLTAAGSMSDSTGTVGQVFTLTDATTQAHTLHIYWGDGTGITSTPTHSYNNIGTYQIIQTVTNPCGYRSQLIHVVTVTGGTTGKGTMTLSATGTVGSKLSYSVLNSSGVSITNGTITVEGASKVITLDGGAYGLKIGYSSVMPLTDPVDYKTCDLYTGAAAVAKCSHPAYTDSASCLTAGHAWQTTGQQVPAVPGITVTGGADTAVTLTNCN